MRDYLKKRVSTNYNGIRKPNGVGYVIIKATGNADRETYITNCKLRGCVTLALDDGGFIENVPVLKHVWDYLIFPEFENELGSQVWWNSVPHLNNLLVVGVIPKNNDILNINENQFNVSREFNGSLIEISGDAKNNKLSLNVDGSNESAELIISVSDKNKSSKLNLIVKGDINCDSINNTINASKKLAFIISDNSIDNNNTVIEYEKTKGLSYIDEFDNKIIINDTFIRMIHKNGRVFEINKSGIHLGSNTKAKESAVLGETNEIVLKKILTECITECNAIIQYCVTQQVITNSLPWLLPLSPGYATLNGIVTKIVTSLTTIMNIDVAKTKSTKVTLD